MIDLVALQKAASFQKEEIQRQVVTAALTDEEILSIYSTVAKEFVPDYEIAEDNRHVILKMMVWLLGKTDKHTINKGLCLIGTTGCGKTLCFRILKRVAYALGLSYELCGQKNLLSWERYSCIDLADRWAHGDPLKDVISADVVLLDNLGIEERICGNSAPAVIQRVIEARADKPNKITHFATTHDILAKTLYDVRPTSRIIGMSDLIYFGEDRDGDAVDYRLIDTPYVYQ